MMSPEELRAAKLQDFAAWLRGLPAETTFEIVEGDRCGTCPVARFSGRSTAAWNSDVPNWASEFIDAFDAAKDNSMNSALQALEFVESQRA